jgi:hypothetical protein
VSGFRKHSLYIDNHGGHGKGQRGAGCVVGDHIPCTKELLEK